MPLLLKSRRTLLSILFMVLHAIAMSFSYVVKKLVVIDLSPPQAAFLTEFIMVIFLIPVFSSRKHMKRLNTNKLGTHAARAAFSCLAAVSFLAALKQDVSIADASAITVFEHILIAVVGVIYFKEKFTFTKMLAFTLAIVGFLMVLQPGLITNYKPYIFLFIAIILWTLNATIIKILGKTERTTSQLFFVCTFSCIYTLPLAISDWRPMTMDLIGMLVILAVLRMIHQVCFIRAFKFGEMTVVMPFDYSRVFFTTIFGYLFFGEVCNSYKIMGCVFIVASAIFLIQSEIKYGGKVIQASQKK